MSFVCMLYSVLEVSLATEPAVCVCMQFLSVLDINTKLRKHCPVFVRYTLQVVFQLCWIGQLMPPVWCQAY
jgi:hypothetical protein